MSGNTGKTQQITNPWIDEGWSVATYSPRRFESMCNSGSLFVRHLQAEGRIVSDAHGWLFQKLRNFRPKKNYRTEASGSVMLAKPIERFPSDLELGTNLLAADLAFVAVRNFGICHLASTGRISFDYAEIVHQLVREFGLDARARRLLQDLRHAKARFRQSASSCNINGDVGALRHTLSRFFPEQPLSELDMAAPVRRLSGGYSMLRDLEASIQLRLGHTPCDDELERHQLEQIWKWVRDPRRYSWSVRHLCHNDLLKINLIRGSDHRHKRRPE